jgi:23S rRNA-intervening sequence protein
MPIRSFRDLRVWEAAMDLVEKVYRLTQAFPRQEIYGLTRPDTTGGGFGSFEYSGRSYEGTSQGVSASPVNCPSVFSRDGNSDGDCRALEIHFNGAAH